jgi:hypothetical protein
MIASFPLFSYVARRILGLLGLLHEKKEEEKSCSMIEKAKKNFCIIFSFLP